MVANKIIIWGNDNSNTLGVLRQFGEFGYDVFVIFNCATARIAVKSKYCKHYYVAVDLEDGLNYIISHFSNENDKPFIFCNSDKILSFLDENSGKLTGKFIFPTISEPGRIKHFLNKRYQCELAQEVGLDVPHTSFFKKEQDEVNIDELNIVTPCIIKPVLSRDVSYSFKIKICANEADVLSVLKDAMVGSQFVIQEYVEHDNLVVVDGCRTLDGMFYISGSLVAQEGGVNCDSSFGYMQDVIPSVINVEKLKTYIERIGYYGPFGFDLGVTNEKAYFFESNLRIDATNYLFHKMGFSFLHLWVTSAAGESIDNIPKKCKGKKFFIDDVGLLARATSGEISKETWHKYMDRAEIFKFKSGSDPMPYRWQRLVYLVYPIVTKLRKLVSGR